MFTGIVEEMGMVAEVAHEGGGLRLRIEAPLHAAELRANDSVCVSGVCLTVITQSGKTFSAQVVEETLKKTTLGELTPGARVNLELPVRLNDRLGGHIVQGHTDCTGLITRTEKKETSVLLRIEFPEEFARYVIPEGSIAADGVSLTIASNQGNSLVVSLIPHTLANTTFSSARVGTRLNLEFDVIGKYVESLIAGEKKRLDARPAITPDKLRTWGYSI